MYNSSYTPFVSAIRRIGLTGSGLVSSVLFAEANALPRKNR
jgi:hypothetical protein